MTSPVRKGTQLCYAFCTWPGPSVSSRLCGLNSSGPEAHRHRAWCSKTRFGAQSCPRRISRCESKHKSEWIYIFHLHYIHDIYVQGAGDKPPPLIWLVVGNPFACQGLHSTINQHVGGLVNVCLNAFGIRTDIYYLQNHHFRDKFVHQAGVTCLW